MKRRLRRATGVTCSVFEAACEHRSRRASAELRGSVRDAYPSSATLRSYPHRTVRSRIVEESRHSARGASGHAPCLPMRVVPSRRVPRLIAAFALAGVGALACTSSNADGDECCPPSPRPACCMDFGGYSAGGCRGGWQPCDGMPVPDDPGWRLATDEHGCKVWTNANDSSAVTGAKPGVAYCGGYSEGARGMD